MMLTSFSVTNFRGFNETVTFRLDQASDYQFQSDLVAGPHVRKAIVYGANASGKSSLCNALADIVTMLTDNYVSPNLVSRTNYGSSLNPAEMPCSFVYELEEEGERIRYEYSRSKQSLIEEKLFSDGRLVAGFNGNEPFVDYDHFPELSKQALASYNKTISFIKYLSRSGFSFKKKTVANLMKFADGLLLFRSVIHGNEFAGFVPTSMTLTKVLVDTDGLEDFRAFLRECGIDYQLEIVPTADPNSPELRVVFPHESRNFFDVASTGTRYLLLFFTWVRLLSNKASLLIIDEFDAYYHDDVAISVFSVLRKLDYPVIVTTHRTCLMANSIARPDCVFLLQNNAIKPLAQLTDRELREANNIEKLYRNGAFTE